MTITAIIVCKNGKHLTVSFNILLNK